MNRLNVDMIVSGRLWMIVESKESSTTINYLTVWTGLYSRNICFLAMSPIKNQLTEQRNTNFLFTYIFYLFFFCIFFPLSVQSIFPGAKTVNKRNYSSYTSKLCTTYDNNERFMKRNLSLLLCNPCCFYLRSNSTAVHCQLSMSHLESLNIVP